MYVEKRNFWGDWFFVFNVTVDRGIEKMKCVALDESIDDKNRNIVLVDRYRFEDLWFKLGKREHVQNYNPESGDKQANLARCTKKDWLGCAKYGTAVQVFSDTENNPVPLASFVSTSGVHCSRGCWVKTNGFGVDNLTRLIWLLANGAKEFPVVVNSYESALIVHDLIGVKGSKVYTAKDLHKCAKVIPLTPIY
ncbi:plasmid fertility inhibition factor family protein [Photobacterium leiognathi]|uniref:plasmid fertility inhibition factor family protein n=1 Tax=Photobacterium leiognathi TaxID=553611 RepID=UPI0029824BEA|nr:hypothetical protein [Photobacterium leiognathi]